MQSISKNLIRQVEIIQHSLEKNVVDSSIIPPMRRLIQFIKDIMVDKNKLLIQILNMNDERFIDEFITSQHKYKETFNSLSNISNSESLKRKRTSDLTKLTNNCKTNYRNWKNTVKKVEEKCDLHEIPFVKINLEKSIFHNQFFVRSMGYEQFQTHSINKIIKKSDDISNNNKNQSNSNKSNISDKFKSKNSKIEHNKYKTEKKEKLESQTNSNAVSNALKDNENSNSNMTTLNLRELIVNSIKPNLQIQKYNQSKPVVKRNIKREKNYEQVSQTKVIKDSKIKNYNYSNQHIKFIENKKSNGKLNLVTIGSNSDEGNLKDEIIIPNNYKNNYDRKINEVIDVDMEMNNPSNINVNTLNNDLLNEEIKDDDKELSQSQSTNTQLKYVLKSKRKEIMSDNDLDNESIETDLVNN